MTKESEALATFLSACIDGEMNGDNMKKAMAEYVQPSVPAWQDAPNVPGLWWVAGTAGIFHIDEAALPIYKGSAHRWFGPIPPDSGDKS
jgi:hypothetical protein